MASLKDVTTLVDELEQLVHRLSEEVAKGRTDFLQVVGLADEVAEFADSLAAKSQPQRRKPKRQTKSDGARRSAASAARTEEPTKSELLEQAKEVDIPGRSEMSKDELAEAVESQTQQTREELLEQAQAAGIPGRSEMSKDELAEAVRSQERQTKEELLEQAQAAGIPGRSEMSKQELLEALRTDASLTREELLERANEADIPGRSEMSKEELREALRSASR